MGASPRIGIFGGSFNPPHNGHLGACRYLFARHLVDQVVLVPCLAHPFQKPLAPFADRLAMCKAAVKGIPHVIVSNIEEELGGVSHTMRTVQALRGRYPNARLLLILGEDLLAEMAQWQAIDALRAAVEFLTVPRGTTGPIPGVSATAVRERVAAGRSIGGLVPAPVAEYILHRGLYRSRAISK